ncbi:MAG: nitrogen fixation protein NifU [Pseudomonadota bacterium]|jgi:nitrogen fixation NifU-like protein
MSLDELYQDLILDHHRHPRFPEPLNDPSAAQTVFNPLCGDQIHFAVKSDGERLTGVSCSGHGCAISQASGSMAAELCCGKTLNEVQAINEAFRALMKGEREASDLPVLKDAVALGGVRQFPARTRCAMIAWEALDLCLKDLAAKPKTS